MIKHFCDVCHSETIATWRVQITHVRLNTAIDTCRKCFVKLTEPPGTITELFKTLCVEPETVEKETIFDAACESPEVMAQYILAWIPETELENGEWGQATTIDEIINWLNQPLWPPEQETDFGLDDGNDDEPDDEPEDKTDHGSENNDGGEPDEPDEPENPGEPSDDNP